MVGTILLLGLKLPQEDEESARNGAQRRPTAAAVIFIASCFLPTERKSGINV
jgi:hypothetical protein